MISFGQPFLSEDEVVHHRVESFHRERVGAVAAGRSPLGKRDDGFLVVHLIPHACVLTRTRFDGGRLKEGAEQMSAFCEEGRYGTSKFNVDGLLKVDSENSAEAYMQVFRDGRLEAVKSAITFQPNRQEAQPGAQAAKLPRYLRDALCEQATFRLVGSYLTFCQNVGLTPPVVMLSALVGCEGVSYYSDWGYRSDQRGIDRSPAYLPEVEVSAFDVEPTKLLRTWCDTVAQAIGFAGSPNFDESGTWRQRRW